MVLVVPLLLLLTLLKVFAGAMPTFMETPDPAHALLVLMKVPLLPRQLMAMQLHSLLVHARRTFMELLLEQRKLLRAKHAQVVPPMLVE